MARAPRADALRNRERVLSAADAVFAAHGPAASTEEVARAAGVGVGTVFRHFPTKEALLAAVFKERVAALAAKVDALAAAEAGPALNALIAYVATADVYAEALDEARAGGTEIGRELTRVLDVLLARAREARAVRADIGAGDLLALLSGVAHAAREAPSDVREKVAAVVVTGLRPQRAD